MTNLAKESTIRKNKSILIVCSAIFVCFALIPLIFLFKHDLSFGKNLILLIFAPILGYLFYLVVYTGPPFLLLIFSNKSRSDYSEIASMEKEHHKSSRRLIINRLGLIAYLKCSGGINRGLNSGYEYCKNLLEHKKVQYEEDLKFHILMRLYECSILDEKYGRAVDYLEMAHKIRPDDFLASYLTAETNELIGNAEKAIRIYQNIVADCTTISDSLKEYLKKQIERIIAKGPQSPSPVPGWERRFNSLPDSPADFYSNNNVNSLPLPIFFHLIP